MGRKRTEEEIQQINADLRSRFGATMTRQNMLDYEKETGVFAVWIYRDPSAKVGMPRGTYRIPEAGHTVASVPAAAPAPVPAPAPAMSASAVTVADDEPEEGVEEESEDGTALTKDMLLHADIHTKMAAIRDQASLLARVPEEDPSFVPFGDFEVVDGIINSGQFFPVFITGLSGNGKTFQVEQSCARRKREYIRVNITAETDEDDLIGGFRLVNGNTVFELGPALVAMLRGAVLLLDEVDLASAKLMCLQPILEGKPITVKKLGITVKPTKGFTVLATANTKGKGDLDGRFVGTNLLNEAFLDRFPFTIEQEYPTVAVEKKILKANFEAAGYKMTPHARTFFDTLAKWASHIRETYDKGGVEEIIATRRLVHIVRAYGIFNGDEQKALTYAVNRFDPKTKDAFIDFYNKLAPDAAAPDSVGTLDGTDAF